ncbi:MAG: tetratricopeptide repeat protein [Spirochaetales bacterium]|nr:tetratricopeptide repeat protein [Spirochaetales bacterium]
MKSSKFKGLIKAAIILVPLFLPLPPLARFGIPLIAALYTLISGRGNIWYIFGLRAGRNRDHKKTLKYMLKAARAGLSIKNGCLVAVSLLKYDKYEEAEQLFTFLEAKNKTTSQIKYLRSYKALLFWYNDEKEEAVSILENLLDGEDRYRTTHIYSTLGYFLLHTENAERALELNLEAVDYDSTPDILDNLTASYINIGDWENAEETCKKVIESNPAFAEAWYHAGLIAENSGDYESADSHFKKSLRSIFSNLTLLKRKDVEEKIQAMQIKEEKQKMLAEELPMQE